MDQSGDTMQHHASCLYAFMSVVFQYKLSKVLLIWNGWSDACGKHMGLLLKYNQI